MYNVEKMSKHTLNVNTAKFLKICLAIFQCKIINPSANFLFISVFLLQNLIFFFFLNVIFLILIEVAENEMG